MAWPGEPRHNGGHFGCRYLKQRLIEVSKIKHILESGAVSVKYMRQGLSTNASVSRLEAK